VHIEFATYTTRWSWPLLFCHSFRRGAAIPLYPSSQAGVLLPLLSSAHRFLQACPHYSACAQIPDVIPKGGGLIGPSPPDPSWQRGWLLEVPSTSSPCLGRLPWSLPRLYWLAPSPVPGWSLHVSLHVLIQITPLIYDPHALLVLLCESSLPRLTLPQRFCRYRVAKGSLYRAVSSPLR